MNLLEQVMPSDRWLFISTLIKLGIIPDDFAGHKDRDDTISRGLNGIMARLTPYDPSLGMIRYETWDEALELATKVAERGTCPRRKVGALFAREDGVVLATGANTSPPGQPSCLEAGCLLETHDGDERCIRTLHAEIAARMELDDLGISPHGLTLVCTCRTCHVCSRHATAWRIRRMVHGGAEAEDLVKRVLEGAGIEVIKR